MKASLISDNQQKSLQLIIRIATVLVAIATSSLIFIQVLTPPGTGYDSDWLAHLDFVRHSDSSSTYSLFHLIAYLAFTVFHNYYIMFLVAAGMVIAANIASYFLIRKYLLQELSDKSICFVEFLSLSLFLVSMIFIIYPGSFWYLGQGTPNPWHNPTYPVARPFAIGAFMLISKVNDLINEGKSYTKQLIGFAVSMLFVVLMKPSFYFVFIPALFCYYLFKLIKSKFSIFRDCFFLGLSVVPAGLVLIVQNTVLFNEENKIAISLTGELWNTYAICGSVVLSIILALAFPLFVATTSIKKLKYEQIIVILTCLFGILEAYFLIEKGSRYADANFFWGYYYSMFFAFLSFSILFFREKNKPKWKKHIGIGLFVLHLLSGITYLIKILLGFSYT